MPIQIYTTEELQEICRELFYDYMASTIKGTTLTPAHLQHSHYEELIVKVAERIKSYKSAMQNKVINKDNLFTEHYKRQIESLKEYQQCLNQSNLEFQKQTYEKTKDTLISRTTVKFSLENKINPIYDDFELEVLFYDDVCTLKGKFEKYRKLKTKKERLEFFKDNTEVTHMGLHLSSEYSCPLLIGLQGKVNMQPSVQTLVLPSKYADLNNITSELIENLNNHYYRKNKRCNKHFKSTIEILKDDLANSYKKCYNKNKLTTNIIDEFPEEIEY